jgi:hypothetical protein
MNHDRWKFAESIISAFCRDIQGLFFVMYPQPIEVILFESPVMIESRPPLFRVMRLVYEAVRLLNDPSIEQLSRFLRLPPLAVKLILGRMRRIRLVEVDAAGRWSLADLWSRGTEEFVWRRTCHRLVCYWPKEQLLLPVEPRVRLRDLVYLETHRMGADLQDVYQSLVRQSHENPFVLADGERLWLLPVQDVHDVAEHSHSSSPPPRDFSETSFPSSSFGQSQGSQSLAPASSGVLTAQAKLDVMLVSWVVRQGGLWVLKWRIWSRLLAPDEVRSQASFAPGPVCEGLRIPVKLAGRSLDELRLFFDPGSDRWRSLIALSEGGSLGIRRTLHPEAKTLLEITSSSSETDKEFLLIPSSQGPMLRFLARHPSALGVEEPTVQ